MQVRDQDEALEFEQQNGVWHDPISRRLRAVSTVIRKAAPSLLRSVTLAFAYYAAAVFALCLTIIALDARMPLLGGALGILTLFLVVKSKIHDIRAARHEPDPQQ